MMKLIFILPLLFFKGYYASFPVTFDARTMPYIACNVRRAWDNGLPSDLTYLGNTAANKKQRDDNRYYSCRTADSVQCSPGYSCDEYPFASTVEGGGNGHEVYTCCAPVAEQQQQAGILSVAATASINTNLQDREWNVILTNELTEEECSNLLKYGCD